MCKSVVQLLQWCWGLGVDESIVNGSVFYMDFYSWTGVPLSSTYEGGSHWSHLFLIYGRFMNHVP